MGKEIERKFLVKGYEWKEGAMPSFCRQGYLSTEKNRVVRVRTLNSSGFITIKGMGQGLSRSEYEYEIPLEDAEEILFNLCKRPLIEKDRYTVSYNGVEWTVDLFYGENQGLVLAEVELESEKQDIVLPPWVGKEVTDDSRYYNVNLVDAPFTTWKQDV